jgi:hypothetical protein
MASGICPECDRLYPISPTGEMMKRKGKDMPGLLYWRIDAHKCLGPVRALCEGSGEKV